MLKTVIYGIYLIALIGATIVFVLKADNHWQTQFKIRNNLLGCDNEEEMQKHQRAFNNSTIDAVCWTAIAICSIYACFDCLVSMLNTL